ncbi:Laccase-1 [Wallemia ichthyophaga EXF-994]|uniref:Laccase-1 n=1 Tax=Wallemia ichthyophaga (strain EXF-994 / CBS 113033) TaxID=1299270 RepID=R9AGK9_WALI9|nr:Laccase-1 [Wallemia ichthyophaga EXF-994]EOR01328.1 Laccase-1 [Wallemia ichthyophaga EXF-994]TIB35425.1 hypothetical protein E3P84_01353 [Wallemia ichthyophaga]TIB42242.1 hypothetical protein E3P83_01302 [Wallemia ichthyophaga]
MKHLYTIFATLLSLLTITKTQSLGWKLQHDLQGPIQQPMRPEGDGRGGNTRYITLNITDELASLDGDDERYVYAVNGRAFNGGEAIFLEEDEEVEIELNNNSKELNTSTTLHAHGIEQIGSVYNDGVPGVSQNVIKPGESFIYRWRAAQYGLYWLHSHFSGIYQDGQVIPLYIRPKQRKNPFSIISDDQDGVRALERHDQNPTIITITDYTQLTIWEQLEKAEEWQSELLCANSLLINGQGRVNCPTSEHLSEWTDSNTTTAKGCIDRGSQPGYENVTFDKDLWYTCTPTDVPLQTFEFDYESGWGVIHFLSASGHWNYLVSIDEHELNFFAADGNYAKPVKGEAFSIGIGERIGVAFRLHTPGEYTLRISAYNEPQVIGQFAIIRYGLADDDDRVEYSDPASENDPGMPSIPLSEPFINYAGQPVSGDIRVLNDSLISLKQFAPPLIPKRGEAADVTLHYSLSNANFLKWSMSEWGTVEYYAASNELNKPPVLYDFEQYIGDESIASYPNGSVVDVIITNGADYGDRQPAHPIHKHFEHYHVLAAGTGNFSYWDVVEAEDNGVQVNWLDPPYRDTVLIPESTIDEGSYLIFRYESVQPTAALLHCHVNMHNIGGMAYVLIATDEGGTPAMPEYYSVKALNKDLNTVNSELS